MSLPEGTLLAGGSEIVCPQIKPEDIKVFLAEDSASKREAVVTSLTELGLAQNLITARTYAEAEVFMQAQEPGQLAANVFLLDGQLDETRRGGQRQGDELAQTLFRKYTDPLMTRVLAAGESLKREGLTRREIDKIIQQEAVYNVAAQRLGREALLVGISRTDKGELGMPAQVSLAPYSEVGQVVFQLAVPEATRNRITKQQRREADRARSRTGQ